MARHLSSFQHADHPDIVRLPPKTSTGQARKDRLQQLDKLRNLGDFLHNVQVLQNKDPASELIVGRRSTEGTHLASHYLACRYCLVFYLRGELWRHAKNCEFRRSPLNARPESEEEESLAKEDLVKCGKLLIMGANTFGTETKLDKDYIRDVLLTTNDDMIGKKAKGDGDIVALGAVLYKKLGTQRSGHIRSLMRLLARVKVDLNNKGLSHVNTFGPRPDLADYLRPECFDQVCMSIQRVAAISDQKTVNGVQMLGKPGNALKLVGECNSALQLCCLLSISMRSIQICVS